MGHALSDTVLGDVVVLPDGRALTVRSRVDLPVQIGSINGFVLMGELEALLGFPPLDADPFLVYQPVPYLPVDPSRCRLAAEGVTRYWAPHLPAASGAMGEVAYRVLEVRGQLDPVVIVYRSSEMVVFVRTAIAFGNDLKVLAMDRPLSDSDPVARHAAFVDRPAWVQPTPVQQPVPEPARRR